MTRMAVAVTAMLLAGAAAGDGLGRLFTTPAQRAEIDRLRAEAAAPALATAPSPPPAEAPPAPPAKPLRVDGLVLRPGGKATAWVNGRALTPDGAEVAVDRQRRRVRVRPAPQAPAVELAPGQRYDPASGQVSDVAAP